MRLLCLNSLVWLTPCATASLAHCIHCTASSLLPAAVDDLVTEEFPPGAKKAPGETSLGFVKRVMTEGHTIPDALLSVAASQVGVHGTDNYKQLLWPVPP